MAKNPLSFSFLFLVLLLSCGKDGAKRFTPGLDQLALEDDREGIYRAYLKPLNDHETKGTITVRMEQDEFVVREAIAGAPENIMHFQFIAEGPCPTMELDANGDGVLDMNEARGTLGKILIPLDSDLNSQLAGSDFGPIANPAGAIVYQRRGSVSKLLSDLHAVDPSETDHLDKLPSGTELVLTGKSVIILGTKKELPESVSSFGPLSQKASVPIACGEFFRAKSEVEDLQNLDL